MNNVLEFPFAIQSAQEEGIIEGYASVFNVQDIDNDVVLPGAFKNSKKESIKFLWQHIPEEPIGQIVAMHEDAKGLYIKAQLIFSVQRAYEAYMMIKSNVLNGLSIGYVPISYEESQYDSHSRFLKSIDLKEISLVTFPANKEAKITKVKSEIKDDKISLSRALDRAMKALQ